VESWVQNIANTNSAKAAEAQAEQAQERCRPWPRAGRAGARPAGALGTLAVPPQPGRHRPDDQGPGDDVDRVAQPTGQEQPEAGAEARPWPSRFQGALLHGDARLGTTAAAAGRAVGAAIGLHFCQIR